MEKVDSETQIIYSSTGFSFEDSRLGLDRRDTWRFPVDATRRVATQKSSSSQTNTKKYYLLLLYYKINIFDIAKSLA